MAIKANDIVNIFTGMDSGPESIAQNFNKLLAENIDQDNQLATLNNQALQIGNFIGYQNPDINENVSVGFHGFGFWADNKVPTGNGWPKQMENTMAWGCLMHMGTTNSIKTQLIFNTGGWMFMRIYAGTAWDKWTIVQTKYEQ
ncbi:hypothetical protein [Limosilactobacillus vaginalis]|uniref:hypothetical protein n=1 Tax=Limosilactobacillus vaginalis TaxID=1633 RepID=UPI00361D050E